MIRPVRGSFRIVTDGERRVRYLLAAKGNGEALEKKLWLVAFLGRAIPTGAATGNDLGYDIGFECAVRTLAQ